MERGVLLIVDRMIHLFIFVKDIVSWLSLDEMLPLSKLSTSRSKRRRTTLGTSFSGSSSDEDSSCGRGFEFVSKKRQHNFSSSPSDGSDEKDDRESA